MYAPLGFFLQNPVGEILVAFTKEQDIMDENLVDTLHYLGIYGLIMCATIITVSVSCCLPLPPMYVHTNTSLCCQCNVIFSEVMSWYTHPLVLNR
jgi:hypothetical protein